MASSSWLPSLFGDRKDQADPFLALRKQMDDVLDGFFKAAPSDFLPSVDVSETDKEIRIVAELPGVDRKDIDVTLAGNQLTIKGEKRSEHEERGEKDESGRQFHRVERSFGSFRRTMTLPYRIDPSAVAADFKDGVLTVTVPKPAEVVANTRKIEIKASS
jgi:HSP20 family protein